MKSKTFTGQGYIYFVYEDYDGERYNTYAEMKRYGRKPFSVFGYYYSYYYGNEEPIDELELSRKPTTGQVREFITRCKKIINQ